MRKKEARRRRAVQAEDKEFVRVQIDFLQDKEKEMTWGRWIALKLMDKSWYYPKAEVSENIEKKDPDVVEQDQQPSLEKAWAYFEHVALERYIVQDKNTKQLERAEPGERNYETRLYNPFFTPHDQVRYFKTASAKSLVAVNLNFTDRL
jgi:hypothetical protein